MGIDVSLKAYDLVKERLHKEVAVGSDDKPTLLGNVVHRTDIPNDRDGGRPSKDIKHILYGKQEGICPLCNTHFPFRNMTKDHKVTTSKRGSDTDDNLQLLC